MNTNYLRAYENWIPVIARYILAIAFGISAFGKIAFFGGEVAMTSAAGVPFPTVAVGLALILEVCAIIALVIGWHVRIFAFLLAGFVLILAFVFFRSLSTQAIFGDFVSCFELIAGLLYVSVYGARHAAVKKSALPIEP